MLLCNSIKRKGKRKDLRITPWKGTHNSSWLHPPFELLSFCDCHLLAYDKDEGKKRKKKRKTQATYFASPLRFHHLQWPYLQKETIIQTTFSQDRSLPFCPVDSEKTHACSFPPPTEFTNSQSPGTSFSSISIQVKTLLSKQLSRFHHYCFTYRSFMSF